MPDTMQLKEGTKLQGGKYEILRTLGQGGFGITYEASQVLLQRKVAVKEFFMKNCCERERTANQVTVGTGSQKDLVTKFLSKFIREAQMIASMNHPHIVGVHDIFEENGTAYYVMECLDGGSLSDRVRKHGPLPEDEAENYIRQVADALSFIHARNTVHLDVKPSNILLNAQGKAVLVDFGISKHYDESGEQTSFTPVGISKGYAPLEQGRDGDVSQFTPCTDIYALGATLYHLVTGTIPQEASIINEEGLSRPDGISDRLWCAIEKCMQPKRKDRPQCIADFLALLETDTMIIVEEECTVIEEECAVVEDDPPKRKSDPGIEMVHVEEGIFMMGSRGFFDVYDKPVHEVKLSGYYIGKYEVTQALWESVMGTNPSRFKGADLPVENVSWNDVQEFISKLNAKTGKEYRLPTEAEWEYAARGGKKSLGYKYSGSDDVGTVAWYSGNSDSEMHPVGMKRPNELGIYDMSGNVWEWCSDWYGDYSAGFQSNPKGPSSGSARVLRGGSWISYTGDCRISYRCSSSPGHRSRINGFRLAASSL